MVEPGGQAEMQELSQPLQAQVREIQMVTGTAQPLPGVAYAQQVQVTILNCLRFARPAEARPEARGQGSRESEHFGFPLNVKLFGLKIL